MAKSKKVSATTSRLITGAVIFVVGMLAPLFIPLVLAADLSTSMTTLLTGLLAFGIPEIFILIAVAILGQDGFDYLMRLFWLLFRRYIKPRKRVSQLRYRLGLVMFTVPFVVGWLSPYVFYAYEDLFDYYLQLNISFDLVLLASLFVLGGNFWEKLHALFVYQMKVTSRNKIS